MRQFIFLNTLRQLSNRTLVISRCQNNIRRNTNSLIRSGKVVFRAEMSTQSSISGNRLKDEKSPYLLQHAHNPVDWYPWGEEAIQRAKSENKLIFLSVGYATCHWCHVMEHESFMNPEVAAIMNDNFVNIKVDREERPDIDKIYMTFLTMINNSGGWPMSVWITPDLAPITAGTYFPPENRWGVPGFKTVLLQIAEKWQSQGEDLAVTGRTIISKIQEAVEETATDEEDITIENKFNKAVRLFKFMMDKEWGGFNRATKFPEVSKLNFILQCYWQSNDEVLFDLLLLTLKKIAHGGIHDHISGGFSRYSVDRKWHVPHFEKMLYDQAQLMGIYSNVYKVTRNPFYLKVCDGIFQYLCSCLMHRDGGGFYSGEDADSYPPDETDPKEKIEGSFYAWRYEEIEEIFFENKDEFSQDNAFEIFTHHFDVQKDGNVSAGNDPHGHFLGKNILFVKGSLAETASKFKLESVDEIIDKGCKILDNVRKDRPRPQLDTKIICSWNGLMLSGLSKLAGIKDAPNREQYLKRAQDLVLFLRTHFYDEHSQTLRRSCYGEGGSLTEATTVVSGFLDDYAFLIRGLLDYYTVSLDNEALRWAKSLQESQDRLFWDETNGGYYYSEAESPNVVIRLKEDHDGAEPCGNSVSVTNLLLLSAYFEDKALKGKAQRCLDFFKGTGNFGYTLPEMMAGALFLERGLQMLVVVGPDSETTTELLDVARDAYIPGLIVFHLKIEEPDSVIRQSIKMFKMVNNCSTAYLCHNRVCQLPMTDPKTLSDALSKQNSTPSDG